jgi:hypothetical protein
VIVAEAMEGHNARILGTGGIGPRHALIRDLFGDYGIPFFLLATDVRFPVY